MTIARTSSVHEVVHRHDRRINNHALIFFRLPSNFKNIQMCGLFFKDSTKTTKNSTIYYDLKKLGKYFLIKQLGEQNVDCMVKLSRA